ncbi:hypothetical protein FKM82_022416 [Ascaphus truei]
MGEMLGLGPGKSVGGPAAPYLILILLLPSPITITCSAQQQLHTYQLLAFTQIIYLFTANPYMNCSFIVATCPPRWSELLVTLVDYVTHKV